MSRLFKSLLAIVVALILLGGIAEAQVDVDPTNPFWRGLVILGGLALLVALIVYYTVLVRAILEMLTGGTNTVLLVFAFMALLPLPPTLVAGIVLLIIWKKHKKAIREEPGSP